MKQMQGRGARWPSPGIGAVVDILRKAGHCKGAKHARRRHVGFHAECTHAALIQGAKGMRASQTCMQLNIKMPCWSAQRSVAADKEACRSTAAMHACTAQGACGPKHPSPTRLLTRKDEPAPHTLCCSALKRAASSSLQHGHMAHEVGFEGVNMRGGKSTWVQAAIVMGRPACAGLVTGQILPAVCLSFYIISNLMSGHSYEMLCLQGHPTQVAHETFMMKALKS